MKKLFPLFLVLLSLVINIPSSRAAVFNVSNSAELQSALTMAVASMEDDTINLAAGQYNTTGSEFDGMGLGIFSLNLVGAGPGMTILDGQNANRIMALSTGAGNLSISGITFQNGNAGANPGGALNATTGAGFISLDNCEFINNQNAERGGGIRFNTGATGEIRVTNSTFTNNRGDSGGGLWMNTGNGPVIVEGCTFTNNSANNTNGGGARANTSDGPVTFTNNTFNMNTAAVDGGAIRINTSDGDVTMTGNSFTDSTATSGDGGAVRHNSSGGNFTFNNNTVNQAIADSQGGGVYFNTSTGTFTATNNTFTNGIDSAGDGGAIWFRGSNSSANIINNIIADSMAQVDGGGIYLETSGMNTVNIINNTITANIAGNAGGGARIILNDMSTVVNFYNNIIWNNISPASMGQDVYVDNTVGGTFRLFNNDFTEICFTGGSCDPTSLGPDQGANKINENPLFLDPPAFNFQLGSGSPAIDMGTAAAPALPATDHDGNPRIFGPEPDMGALEALPLIMISPTAHDFGQINVGSNSSVDITVTNAGSIALDVTGMTLVDSDNFSLDVNGGANPCGSTTLTLASGTSCTVTVTFAPNGDGSFNATLNVTSNDPGNPSLQATFTGVGVGSGFFVSGGSCSLGSHGPQGFWLVSLLSLALCFGMIRGKRSRIF